MVGKSVETCWSVRACFSMAATTRGSQWPRLTVTIPPKKSRYFFPSASKSHLPSPFTKGNGSL